MNIKKMAGLKAENIKNIILHTAAHGVPDDEGNIPPLYNTTFKQIDRWHKDRWGDSGFGYHGLVDTNGNFYQGRPLNKRGAHCTSQDMNLKSLGLCMSGNGDYHHWTTVQYKTAIAKVYEWCKQFNVPFKNVLGHRETGAKKSCPGNLINMDRFREDLQLYANTFIESKILSTLAKHYAKVAFTILYSKIIWDNLPADVQHKINELRNNPIFKNI